MTLIIAILCLCTVLFPANIDGETTSLNVIYVDDDNIDGPWDGSIEHPYRFVQDAIDNASSWSTIFIYGGFYEENIKIIIPINLIGEDKNTTFIDGSGFSNIIIKIDSSNVKISKLTLQNSNQSSFAQAIHIYNSEKYSSNYEISDCIIKNNGKGIYLKNVSNISISNCDIYCNVAQSILGRNVKNINIVNCTINNNGIELENNWIIYGGIDLSRDNLSNIKIVNCNISENIGTGIHIVNMENILITKNEIHKNSIDGIYVFGVNNISVVYNKITMNNYMGIDLIGENCQNIGISYNNILNNGKSNMWLSGGIYIEDCNNCISITNNNISYNDPTGLFFLRSEGNSIFQNNFIENECNVFFVKKNSFEKNSFDENYWGRSRLFPYPVLGLALFGIVPIPWINFDWFTAKEPYDIL